MYRCFINNCSRGIGMRKNAAFLIILTLCFFSLCAQCSPEKDLGALEAQAIQDNTFWDWPLSTPEEQGLDAEKLSELADLIRKGFRDSLPAPLPLDHQAWIFGIRGIFWGLAGRRNSTPYSRSLKVSLPLWLEWPSTVGNSRVLRKRSWIFSRT